MANIRCFDSFTTNLTSSEWSNAMKKKTIYNEIKQNVLVYNTANPVKQNGKKYNNNTKVNTTCDISSGYIEFAASYDLMNAVSRGAALCNPTPPVHISPDEIMENCSTACKNTFDNGFQDTNMNKDNEFIDFGGPFIIMAGQRECITQMIIGSNRYQNATFMGEFDISINTNPIIVFQFSQDGINWFSDGLPAALFDPNPPSNIRQFCFQRGQVSALWIGIYYVSQATVNKIQLVLTKN